jgi:hypothetical protein
MELVNCTSEYWEFVRLIRTDPSNKNSFLTQPTITPQQQIEFMEKNSYKYKICLLNEQNSTHHRSQFWHWFSNSKSFC